MATRSPVIPIFIRRPVPEKQKITLVVSSESYHGVKNDISLSFILEQLLDYIHENGINSSKTLKIKLVKPN